MRSQAEISCPVVWSPLQFQGGLKLEVRWIDAVIAAAMVFVWFTHEHETIAFIHRGEH
jgi:hypothetical protein